MVCQFLGKFDGHWYCSSRDMALVCHVSKHDHIIKGSGDYKDKSPSKKSHHPAKFGGHRNSGSRDIMALVCQMTLQDHVIKALYD